MTIEEIDRRVAVIAEQLSKLHAEFQELVTLKIQLVLEEKE